MSVERMVASLKHRGPDESGIANLTGVAFGATRLAIRGSIGKQPLVDLKSGVVVACNGEIDNHRELRAWVEKRGHTITGDSDVAVLPALYLECGEAFVERLVGAFAVALFDPRDRSLRLARDRVGERPLFYSVCRNRVTFATEISAIAKTTRIPLSPDIEAIQEYLRFGSFFSPNSPFRQIRKVAPGELVTIGPDAIERRRYWRWPVVTTKKRPGSMDAFDHIFRRAVERQADVDVEFGTFLSGGVDSSLVTAVLRSVRPDHAVRAYTLRFDTPSFDEGHYAHQVADRIGVQATDVWVRPETLPAAVAKLVRTTGEPLADPAWGPTSLLAQRASQDISVALVGEGADELFGGYPTYLGLSIARQWARLPRYVRSALKFAIRRMPVSDRKVTLGFLLKRFVAAADLDGWSRHRFWTSNMLPSTLQELGQNNNWQDPKRERGALLDLIQRNDLESTLAEGLLTKADRASMTWALELRSPFLDRDVLDFASTLPSYQRVSRMRTKVFLKEYALRYLPRSIVFRKKRGLSVPLSAWLRGPLRKWARDRIESGLLPSVGISQAAARDLLLEHFESRADHARPLWTLILLVEWLEWASTCSQSPS